MKKKQKAIVLGATGNMAFAVGNVLIGIKKYSPDFDGDFIILQNDFLESDKEVLNRIFLCKFIEYKFPQPQEYKNSHFYRYSLLAFSRYEIFNWLDEYEKIAWLDIDILVQDDIQKLFDACVDNMGWKNEHLRLGGLFTKELDIVKNDNDFFNSGVIVFTDKIPNYKILTKWCYDKTFEFAEYLSLPDQAVLNHMIYEFPEIKVTDVGKKFNCYPTDKDVKNAVILHSYSSEKFWNFYNIKEWNQNYKNWLKLGGSKYKGPRANFIYKTIKKFIPEAPNPFRYPKAFIKLLVEKFFKN